MIRLSDFTKEEVLQIFDIVGEIKQGKYKKYLQGKTVVMFFPSSSIRTRVTFEKGIYLLGGQSILFTPDTLDKKEELRDVVGYLNNWADMYALSKIRDNFVNDKYLFVGAAGNIGYAWKEAAELMGFSLVQCCPVGYHFKKTLWEICSFIQCP